MVILRSVNKLVKLPALLMFGSISVVTYPVDIRLEVFTVESVLIVVF